LAQADAFRRELERGRYPVKILDYMIPEFTSETEAEVLLLAVMQPPRPASTDGQPPRPMLLTPTLRFQKEPSGWRCSYQWSTGAILNGMKRTLVRPFASAWSKGDDRAAYAFTSESYRRKCSASQFERSLRAFAERSGPPFETDGFLELVIVAVHEGAVDLRLQFVTKKSMPDAVEVPIVLTRDVASNEWKIDDVRFADYKIMPRPKREAGE